LHAAALHAAALHAAALHAAALHAAALHAAALHAAALHAALRVCLASHSVTSATALLFVSVVTLTANHSHALLLLRTTKQLAAKSLKVQLPLKLKLETRLCIQSKAVAARALELFKCSFVAIHCKLLLDFFLQLLCQVEFHPGIYMCLPFTVVFTCDLGPDATEVHRTASLW
jgi:hypothetical protein